MSYILVDVMEDSIFVIDSIPVEYIIFPKCIFEKLNEDVLSLITYNEYKNISFLYNDIKNKLFWMGEVDIIDIIQNRILWDPTKIDIIKIN